MIILSKDITQTRFGGVFDGDEADMVGVPKTSFRPIQELHR